MKMHPNSLANLKPIKKGEVRNPKGRKRGSKDKLSEAFVSKLLADFEKHGEDAIVEVRETKTVDYLRIIASIVPKDYVIEEGESAVERLLTDIPDGELAGFVEGVRLLAIACEGGAGASQSELAGQPSELH